MVARVAKKDLLSKIPKGPFRTKNTTTIVKIVFLLRVVFLLRPPYLLRRRPFFERENVCDSQENGVRTKCAAIVNHSAIVNLLLVVNLLRVVFLVRRGPLGTWLRQVCQILSLLCLPRFVREIPKRSLAGDYGGDPNWWAHFGQKSQFFPSFIEKIGQEKPPQKRGGFSCFQVFSSFFFLPFFAFVFLLSLCISTS